MTREEAIKILNTVLLFGTCDCPKKEIEECLKLAIKALGQETTTKIEESNFSQEQYLADIQSAYDCGKSVLDKIRERIELEKLGYPPSAGYYKAIMKVLEIIDKYKAESGENEE